MTAAVRSRAAGPLGDRLEAGRLRTGAGAIGRTQAPGTEPVVAPVEAEVTDAELVARCTDDPEAFGLLYDRYCRRVHGYVYGRLRDRGAAEDVTAEVFLKALRGLGGYRPSAGEFSSWLFRIAGNAVIDHVRARRLTSDLDDQPERGDPAVSVEQLVIDREEVDRVWRAVDQLSTAQRTAVVLRLERDLPIAEIAGHLNRSEGAVRVLLHRGMAAVRERLAEESHGAGHGAGQGAGHGAGHGRWRR